MDDATSGAHVAATMYRKADVEFMRETASTRQYLRRALNVACAADIVRNAMGVSMVVGSVLNLVNQGARWLDGEGVLIGGLVLNYAIPYFVATFSAVRIRLRDIESHNPPLKTDDVRN